MKHTCLKQRQYAINKYNRLKLLYQLNSIHISKQSDIIGGNEPLWVIEREAEVADAGEREALRNASAPFLH